MTITITNYSYWLTEILFKHSTCSCISGGGSYLIGAQKDGTRYRWVDTNRNAYFNTTELTDDDQGDCVVLDAESGTLRGSDCNSHRVLCQKSTYENNK